MLSRRSPALGSPECCSTRPEIHGIAGHRVSPGTALDHSAAYAVTRAPHAVFGLDKRNAATQPLRWRANGHSARNDEAFLHRESLALNEAESGREDAGGEISVTAIANDDGDNGVLQFTGQTKRRRNGPARGNSRKDSLLG